MDYSTQEYIALRQRMWDLDTFLDEVFQVFHPDAPSPTPADIKADFIKYKQLQDALVWELQTFGHALFKMSQQK